jgi:hypothetical protein
MAKPVLYTSMSRDGFITGPDDGPGNGLGNGGHRLHEWLGDGRRLFGADRIELELSRVLDAPGVTHLRYRVAAVGTASRH